MKLSKAGLLGTLNSSKMLAAVVVVAALMITSTVAAMTLSDSGASGQAGGSGPTIIQMDSDPDEAYVDEPVVWNVMVCSQIQGDEEGGLLFTWDWDDGDYTVVFTEYSVENSIVTDVETHAWTQPGTYDVKVSVWDGYKSEQSTVHNVSATMPFTVFSMEVNTPPIADFSVSPEQGTVDTVFTFDASSSSDLEDPLELLLVRWDWQSDGTWDTDYTDVKTAIHQFALTGYYTVALQVMDSGGLTGTAYECATVLDTGVLTPHDPIYISGDAHFAEVASEEGWAGAGTEADPYIIEFLDLSASYASVQVYVTDTTAHFVIRDCLLSGASSSAIYLVNVANVTVQSSLFLYCPSVSIYCEQCTDVTILDNHIDGGARCLSLIRCTDAYLGNNIVEDAEWYPLCIESSYDVTLRENGFHGAGIKLGGYLVAHWNSHDIDDSNSVNYGPVYYIKDRVGGSAPSEAGQVILVNCTDMTVECIATGGITLGFSPNCLVTGSAVSSVHWGVYISYSPGTTVWSTSAYGCDYGIFLLNSESSTIIGSTVNSCDYGIYIQQSNGFSVLNNTVTDCYSYGIQVFATWYGEIRFNLIARGLQTGLDIAESNYILVTSNDFSDNFIQASEGVGLTGNLWDCGYPTGGNYWSDYQGVDEYSGVDQTEPGPDGIGDTPYVLASGSQDDYPLMEPLFT